MTTTLLQMDLVWADPAANRATAERLMAQAPGSDLYVLPEMFSTGFATKPEGIAEEHGGTLQWMKDMARRHDAAMCGSIATKDGDRYYNRLYFVRPDGTADHYDKHHLFTYSGENLRYSPGTTPVVVEWKGMRIMLQVCYDLRFPIWVRNRKTDNGTAQGGREQGGRKQGGVEHYRYDCIIYVASWPQSRQTAWETLLHARAIENQCWVIGVNRVGKDPGNTYTGGSMVIDPWGNTAARCEDSQESTATASVGIQPLTEFRRQFPVLDDADTIRL